jgi:hypothetical protein
MVTRLLLRSALIATAALSPCLAQAQTIFSTGFEAPDYSATATSTQTNPYTGSPYTAGSGAVINSSQGWLPLWSTDPPAQAPTNFENAVNAAAVQTSVVKSGTQALKVDGVTANQIVFGAAQDLPVSTAAGLYEFSFDMLVAGASVTNTGQWGLYLLDFDFNPIATLGFYGGFGGLLGAGTATDEYFAPGPSYDTWANYKLTLDLTAKTMSVALNGIPVSSMQSLAISGYNTSSTLTMAVGGQVPVAATPFYTTTPERAYFDNLTVTSAPEPGTAVLLMLGGTLVIVRRRCQKSAS